MALKAVVTGVIAEPVLRWTPQQKAVVDLRVNATASNRDKVTGQWSDIGAPLWVGAAFWDAEAQHLADVLHKGDRVSVEGTLVVEAFQRRDGSEGQRYSLRYPRFLGVIPARRRDTGDRGAPYFSGPPTGEIPLGSPPPEAPF